MSQWTRAFVQRLRELGWIEGRKRVSRERPFFLIRPSNDDGGDGDDGGGDDDAGGDDGGGDGGQSEPKPEPIGFLETLEIQSAAHCLLLVAVSDSEPDRADPANSLPPAIAALESALLGRSLAW
jgi:hypothetical protein